MKKKTTKILKSLNINLPRNWGELTSAQVSRVAYYLHSQVTETDFLVQLGIEFSGLKPHGTTITDSGDVAYVYYDRKIGNIVLTAEHLSAIVDFLSWATKDTGPMVAPSLDGYRTPDDALYGITLEQFVTADTACSAYVRTQDLGALRFMCATLYPRKRFDPSRISADAARLKFIPIWNLEAVLLWFSGVKKLLSNKYSYVFSNDGGDGASTTGEEIMLGLLSSLNEGRVVDNGLIKTIDVHEALFQLNQNIKANQAKKGNNV